MSIVFKRKRGRHFIVNDFVIGCLFGVIMLGHLLNSFAHAEPYLAVRSNQKCSTCHVNPIGGGARNTFGAYYGSQVLPAEAGATADGGQLSEIFRMGADLRINLHASDNDAGDESRGFNTQSGQVYLVIQPKDSRFMFYLDEQVAPGGALNREAWIKARLGDSNHYLKAGTLMLPFGYRIVDDEAFGRRISRVTFDSNDTGVELGLEYSKFTLNLAVSNGTPSSTNSDTNFAFASRGEYIGKDFRAGASFLSNQSEQAGVDGETTMFAVFGGFNFWGMNFLTEFDSVAEELNGEETTQEAFLFEINREISKGYNLKLTLEQLDPDTDINENERTRNSLLLEATPWANLQMRSGVRIYNDIPQREVGNGNEVFFQLHLYY